MIAYHDAGQELVAAFPELAPAYAEYVDWWTDEEDPEPRGHYVAYSEVLGPYLLGLLHLPEDTLGRDELLKRVLDFGERLMTEGDRRFEALAIDAVAMTVAGYHGGRELVDRLGGPSLRRWFGMFAGDCRQVTDLDFLDLHAVREVLAAQLPSVELTEIAGITTCGARELPSLAAARATEEGAVGLASYGHSHLYAICRAREVGASEDELARLARDLAEWAGGEEPRGGPAALFWRVPIGERVWQLNRPGEVHAPFHHDPWVHPNFQEIAAHVLDVMRGRRASL
jgi:hypothetical protein